MKYHSLHSTESDHSTACLNDINISIIIYTSTFHHYFIHMFFASHIYLYMHLFIKTLFNFKNSLPSEIQRKIFYIFINCECGYSRIQIIWQICTGNAKQRLYSHNMNKLVSLLSNPFITHGFG